MAGAAEGNITILLQFHTSSAVVDNSVILSTDDTKNITPDKYTPLFVYLHLESMKLRFKVISKATLQKTFFESLYFFGEIDMLLLRNLQNINTVIVLGGLALCLIFMVQVKQLYHKNQKYNRYLGYKQYVSRTLNHQKSNRM